MRKLERWPAALTIAGVDSSGGAGMTADLLAFAAHGVHGLCAPTCLTAQTPAEVRRVFPVSPVFLRTQLATLCEGFSPRAIKTGMLHSAALVRVVAVAVPELVPGVPLVVDPVTVATSGAVLLKPAGVSVLRRELLPLARVMTPNTPEAAALLGEPVASLDTAREAARALHRKFGCAVILKGGHLPEATEAVDVLWDGRRETLLRSPFIPQAQPHGTGCAFSAALTAGLARDESLVRAARRAKAHVTAAIARRVRVGGHEVLRQVRQG